MDKTLEKELGAYLKERNIGADSLEANSIREGAEWGIEKQKAIDDEENFRLMLKSDLECQGKLAKYIIDRAWKIIDCTSNDINPISKERFYELMENDEKFNDLLEMYEIL